MIHLPTRLDLTTGKVVASIPTARHPASVLVSPDGGRVYVVCAGSATISSIDTVSRRVVAAVPLGFNPLDAALTPDGKKLYVTSSSPSSDRNSGDLRGRVAVIDTTTNRVKAVVPVHHGPKAVKVSPDGRWVYVTHWAYDASMLDIIATDTDTLVDQSAPFPGGLSQRLAVSPDRRKIYVLPSPWALAAAVDTMTRGVVSAPVVGQEPRDLAVTPDGRRLYVSHELPDSLPPQQFITALDGSTLQVIATIKLPESSPTNK
jgi:YVTN family beta-propeller protein